MGGIMNDFTDMIGLTDFEGQEEAAQQSLRASERSAALAKENMEFQREQYSDWKNIYGDLQENLGGYYKHLGRERVISLGLQEQQKAHQQTEKQIKGNLAQRGIGGGKYEEYLLSIANNANNMRGAEIRSRADDVVAKQKMGFLSLGLGQGGNMRSTINNAANLGAGTLNNQAIMYDNRYKQLYAHNDKAWEEVASFAEKAYTGLAASDEKLKTNITKVGNINGHNVYTFEFKSNPGKIEIGVMAQEVEKITPDAVVEIDGIKHVDYNKVFNLGD